MKILCAGGTGFIGRTLIKKLSDSNHQLILLTRKTQSPITSSDNVKVLSWDSFNGNPSHPDLNNIDAVINLAGESIAEGRWTESKKERIARSRIDATRSIVRFIQSSKKEPSLLINASAVGFYGNVKNQELDETSAKGVGFLSDLCGKWESEALKAESLGTRVLLLRIGVVLGKNGGALRKMLLPFKMFLGGTLGSGKQWFSWIHEEDLVSGIQHCLSSSNISGVINMVAPKPVTNEVFTKTLAKALNRPAFLPVPGPVLKITLGEMSDMLLEGQKVIPKKLIQSGFKFRYEDLDTALREIIELR